MNPIVIFLIIAGVVVVAMLMRSGDKSGASSAGEDGGSSASVLDDDDDDADLKNMNVPVTAEGIALVPDGHELRLLSLIEVESEEIPDALQPVLDASLVPYGGLLRLQGGGRRGGMVNAKPGTPLGTGDFTAARIRPGVAGSYAWRLETLGRDGDFGFFPFTARAGADAALELLEQHGILSQAFDEDDNPIPVSSEDFEEARRRYEETESSLAIDVDEDGLDRGSSYSDRR